MISKTFTLAKRYSTKKAIRYLVPFLKKARAKKERQIAKKLIASDYENISNTNKRSDCFFLIKA